MDRNTILAIVLSIVLIGGIFVYQAITSNKKPDVKPENISKKQEINDNAKKLAVKKETGIKSDKIETKKDNNSSGAVKLSVEDVKAPKDTNIYPTKDYVFNPEDKNDKIETFTISTDVFKIDFSTLDAAFSNVQFITKKENYKDNGKKDDSEKYRFGYKDDNKIFHLVDAVFEQGKKNILPLATSFTSAENLKSKIKNKYKYIVYKYSPKIFSETLDELPAGVKIPPHLNDKISYDQSKKTLVFKGVLSSASKKELMELSGDRAYQKVVNDLYEKSNIVKLDYVKGSLEDKDDYKINIANLDSFRTNSHNELTFVYFISDYNVSTSKEAKKIQFAKVYSFKNNDYNYMFDIDVIISNLSDGTVNVIGNDKDNTTSFYIHWGQSLGPHFNLSTASSYDNSFNTGYLKMNGFKTEDVEVKKTERKIKNFKWLELDSRYLVAFLIPDLKDENHFGEIRFANSKGEKETESRDEIIGVGFNKFDLEAKKSMKFHLSVFIGPKTRKLLDEDKYKPYNLIAVRDRSWVPLIKPLEWGIEWLLFSVNYLINSFGIAIILVTVVIKIILYPLTAKSSKSMKRMVELQPKIKELQAKYKNKKQELQKATMELYKKEKVNPLGGCLPLILQFPVFIAFYSVLPVILDLKNASFLWIEDLSSPDTVYSFSFWPHTFNILPIIMTVTSFLQMKLSPQPTPGAMDDSKAQTQKMMQYFMPAIFLFIFWSMPSGLVLYWTVQNIISVLQQLYTNYRAKIKLAHS
ncbi:MAG: membrane protein insertase YidC [Spirochaetota bacterium]|nr:membrane protein insertase YidC [Spirochaetota bacterium]